MHGIFKKSGQFNAFNTKAGISYIKAVALMGLFTFVFLGTEYLFVNMISVTVQGNRSVAAQNYALGISAIGFLPYPLFCRLLKPTVRTIISVIVAMASIAFVFLICRHFSYGLTLGLGLFLFLLLGMLGSAAYYKSVCLLESNKYIARIAGVSYMLGTVLQFVNNNFIRTVSAEAAVISVFLSVLVFILIRTDGAVAADHAENGNAEATAERNKSITKIGI